jgi:beta-lactamase superfamily II metal-dependent hydrolase
MLPVSSSLATVLTQALQSDDMDQLDWILQTHHHSSHQDIDTLIVNTLTQVKDPQFISAFFKVIVSKF